MIKTNLAHLGVDIGNSGAKVAWFDGDPLNIRRVARITWSFCAPKKKRAGSRGWVSAAPEDPQWPNMLIDMLGITPASVFWWVASVRRDALATMRKYVERQENHQLAVIDYKLLDLEIDLPEPQRVGTDRLLAAYAAARLFTTRPLLVVEAGTAVTIDVVEESSTHSGRYCGGAIVPGVSLMMRLLSQGADLLPSVDADVLDREPQFPGRSTTDAMLLGTIAALHGAIGRLVQHYRRTSSERVPVITSGGDSRWFAQGVEWPVYQVDELVLQGIAFYAQSQLASEA